MTDDDDQQFRSFICRLLATQGVNAPTKSVPRWLVGMAVGAGEYLSIATKGRLSGPMSRQEYATLGNTITLDIEKAKRELGYRSVISIEQGMQELKNKSLSLCQATLIS